MEFLKTLLVALLLPFIIVLLLAITIIGAVGYYFAWLVGVPVPVTINGQKHRMRWLKPVF